MGRVGFGPSCPAPAEPSLMFKWLFHILIFAPNDSSGKYQNKEKPLKRQRKLGLACRLWEKPNSSSDKFRHSD